METEPCDLCAVTFKLRAKCVDETTLEVTSKDLIPVNPRTEKDDIVPAKFFNLAKQEVGSAYCKWKFRYFRASNYQIKKESRNRP